MQIDITSSSSPLRFLPCPLAELTANFCGFSEGVATVRMMEVWNFWWYFCLIRENLPKSKVHRGTQWRDGKKRQIVYVNILTSGSHYTYAALHFSSYFLVTGNLERMTSWGSRGLPETLTVVGSYDDLSLCLMWASCHLMCSGWTLSHKEGTGQSKHPPAVAPPALSSQVLP